MKKSVLIALAVILAVLLVVAVVVVWNVIKDKDTQTGNDEGNVNDTTVEDALGVGFGGGDEDDGSGDFQLYHFTTVKELEAYSEYRGLKIEKTDNQDEESIFFDDRLTIVKAECYDMTLQFDFLLDESKKNITRVDSYYIPFADEFEGDQVPVYNHSAEELKTEIEKCFAMIENQFNVYVGTSFFIFNKKDGSLLPNQDVSSYEAIISKEAVLDFSLIDESNNYWNIQTDVTEDGVVFVKITNYFNDEQRVADGAHITLNQ